ncbi:MAG: efflux RND transporter periplasmic adaptor subunit [Lachnospiraceae bacterium]
MSEENVKMKKQRKIKPWMIVVAVVGILFVVGIIAMVKAGQEAMKAMESMSQNSDDLYTVEKQDLKCEITTSGDVVGLDEIAYTSPVNAKVEDIKVKVGETVKEGTMLLTYDAAALGDDLAKVELQATSERAAGNASYEVANRAAQKAKEAREKINQLNAEITTFQNRLNELNAIINAYEAQQPATTEAETTEEATGTSTQDATTEEPTTPSIDEATYQAAVTEATGIAEEIATRQGQIAEQQAIIDAAEDARVSGSAATQISVTNQLADMNVNEARETLNAAEAGITAKKKGIVKSIEITKGAFAAETQTVMTIINADDIGVEFIISKDDLGTIKEGQKARVVVAGKEYEGSVAYISRVATMDSALSSGTATVKGSIALDNPGDDIFIGVSAKVYLYVGESKDTLAVPYQALSSDIDGDYVYIVNKENLIERKDVTIGLVTDEYYEIIDGLKVGDKVITNVTKDMKPGNEYISAANPMAVQE